MGSWLWFIPGILEKRKEKEQLKQLESEKQNHPYKGIVYTGSELENFRKESLLLDSKDDDQKAKK